MTLDRVKKSIKEYTHNKVDPNLVPDLVYIF